MATIDVITSRNLTAVTYAQNDIINVLDGVTLTINSQWSIQPNQIQALGTGRIEVSNSSTTTPHLQQFYMQNSLNTGGFLVQQNGVLQVRGGWITVGTSTGTNNQVLFSSNSVGGISIDYPSMIQVETGSGTGEWEVWQAIPEDVSLGTNNTYGFNSNNVTAGTVAVTSGGVVTGTGTAFATTNIGLPFKLPSIARDFVVSAFTSTTSITIQELDGTTYTGGVVAAGSTYIIRSGSLINQVQVGGSEVGKVLFFNPLTTQVRMGDGTNGTKIPTGARVRIPNIHFNSALQQTTLATAITSTAAQAFTLAAAIGPTANGSINVNQDVGSFLLVNGATFERIHFLTRAGAVVSATSQLRGQYGTTAQASFPIGTTVYWLPSPNVTTNNAGFNCNPSGTIDLQICSSGMRFRNDFSNYANLVLNDFGCNGLNVGSSAGTYDLNTLSVLGTSWKAPTAISATVILGSMLGSGRIQNVHANNNYSGNISGTTYNVSNIQNAIQIKNLRCRQWGRNGNTSTLVSRCYLFTTIKCATPVEGLYMAGGGFVIAATTNIDIKDIYIASLPNGNSTSSIDPTIFSTITSTVNSTFRGFQIWGGGIPSRGPIISIDSSCESVVCHNKGYSAIAGSVQTPAIVLDAGLNSMVAFISITNPRVQIANQSYLQGNTTTNSGGLFRMLLIDSITSTAGAGGAYKSGVEIDMVAGPQRAFNTTTTASIVPNLVDVQPIVVLSNTAKTVGSVYVGSFSAQSAFNMYTFTGGTFLDNLGRIYYPSISDSVIVKSVFALKGITNFTGTAFDFNYNLGSGTNPIPAGTTVEFRMTNWGTANTGAFTAFVDNSSLETARAALTGYSSTVGLDLQFRVTGTTAVAGRFLMSIRLPVTIDAAYNPPVSSTEVGISGAQTGTLLAGYLNADPNNPVLQGSLVMGGSFGSIPMPYDYDGIFVDYRLIARLQGWTFINIVDIYFKEDVSIPVSQSQTLSTSGVPIYVSGVTGVAVDHIAETITVSASRSAAQIWSAVQDNLCLLANLTVADPFTTSNGTGFFSTYQLIVTSTGNITSGNISSNVTLSGTLSSGVVITGNVTQATPTNQTGATINGNLTFNTNTPITVIFTNCSISGTISNTGSALVKVASAGTSTFFTTGANVASIKIATVSTPNNLALSTYIIKNGSVNLGWVVQNTARSLEVSSGDTFAIYAVAYGYQRILFYPTASNLNSFSVSLLPETNVDTTLNTTIRDFIATQISTALVGAAVVVAVASDLRTYAPADVLNGLQYYTVVYGELPAYVSVISGTVAGFSIISGGVYISSPAFYAQVNNSVTTTTNLGVLIPLYFDIDPAVYIADPTYTATKKNTSGIVLQTAPWTQQTASISQTDKADIVGGVWDAQTSEHTTAGTTGAALGDALTLPKFLALK